MITKPVCARFCSREGDSCDMQGVYNGRRRGKSFRTHKDRIRGCETKRLSTSRKSRQEIDVLANNSTRACTIVQRTPFFSLEAFQRSSSEILLTTSCIASTISHQISLNFPKQGPIIQSSIDSASAHIHLALLECAPMATLSAP